MPEWVRWLLICLWCYMAIPAIKDWFKIGFKFIIRWMPIYLVRKICYNTLLVSWAMSDCVYRSDEELYGKEEYWAKPEEFWKNKAGDCEDYALFAQDILKSHGYTAIMKSFYYNSDPNLGHAICIATKNKKQWWVLDLDKVMSFNASSEEEAFNKYMKVPKII